VEAPPRPDNALFFPRAAHPRGEVLEMPHGIPEKTTVPARRIFQNPLQRSIGPWPLFQDGIALWDIRRKRTVQLQDCLRRLSLKPKTLRKGERIQVKAHAAPLPVPPRPGWITIGQIGTSFHAAMIHIRGSLFKVHLISSAGISLPTGGETQILPLS
jgi:hypothetical protein